MKPANSYPITVNWRIERYSENPLPDERKPGDLERERIRKKVSLIQDAQELGDALTEVWDD